MDSASAPLYSTQPTRRFERFELRKLSGKSGASSTWQAFDPRLNEEVALCLPRAQPSTQQARDAWTQDVLLASRLKHPCLALTLDTGVHEGWPYVVYERGAALSLPERLQPSHGYPSVLEIVSWTVEILEGLAYAHEAGVAHRDVALHSVLIDNAGHAHLAGLAVGLFAGKPGDAGLAAGYRYEQRAAAECDVLMVGLLLHRLLAGHPALDEADLGAAARRVGLEIVRLPWTTPQPVPETLRAIVNRSTDRQQRQRYLNARTLLSALQGWIATNSKESSGPLALLLDRLGSVGHLPSRSPDLSKVQKMLISEELRVGDMVDGLIMDPALCWELLRVVNSARYQTANTEPSSSISRSIVLLGEQGLRKICGGLRTWPGALQAATSRPGEEGPGSAIEALDNAMKRACISAIAARWLRPFNIGDEEVMMAAMSQHLGKLLVLYHFPEESAQISRLMAHGPPAEQGGPPTPGMSEEAATGAVLGINPDDLAAAVLQHWGFAEAVILASRPLSLNVAPKRPENADDWLRVTASLAHELCTLIDQPSSRQSQLLSQILSRYARPAQTNQKELIEALHKAVRTVDRALYREVFTPAAKQPVGAKTAPA